MILVIEFDHEEDGRWIAEIPTLPGVLVYGDSKAKAKVEALAKELVLSRDIEFAVA